MKSDLDMAIVVPSRRRSHNMPILRSLLPTAIVCVEDSEHDDYARAGVPEKLLLTHPPLKGAGPGVVNWMVDNVDAEILVRCDDDLIQVLANTGSTRRITDPDQILAIIENAARNCQDVGISTFCFSRTSNTTIVRPEQRPIVPTQVLAACVGVLGSARHRKMDLACASRADLDITLQTLLEDRAIYADVRFFFDVGLAGSGRGGGVGLTTADMMRSATELLRHRWGRYIQAPSGTAGRRRTSRPIKLKPNMRANTRAQR